MLLKSYVKIAAIALAGWLPVTAAQAGTVNGISATFDIEGGYLFDSPSGGSNVFSILGTFEGALDSFDPVTPSAYRLGAWLTITDDVAGELVNDGGFIDTPVFSPIDLYDDAVAFVAGEPGLMDVITDVIGFFLAAGEPGGITIPLDPSETDFLTFSWDLDYLNPTGLAGDFALSVLTDEVFSDIGLPDNASGDFALSLSVTPVPVPAALPMLGFAVAGLWAMRRRLS